MTPTIRACHAVWIVGTEAERATQAALPVSGPSGRSGRSEAGAAGRLAQRGRSSSSDSSRSYASIVRANVLTVFNLILAAFGIVALVFCDSREWLLHGVKA